MSILPVRPSIGQSNHDSSDFSLAALPSPIVSIPFPTATAAIDNQPPTTWTVAASIFPVSPTLSPDDEAAISSMSVAAWRALGDDGHRAVDRERDAALARTADLGLDQATRHRMIFAAECRAARAILDRREFEGTLDAWTTPHDDQPAYVPTIEEDAERVALIPDLTGVPPGRRAAREARKSRLARAAVQFAALSDLECYSQGQAAGDADLEPIAPHGMSPRQAARFLEGWEAGNDLRWKALVKAWDSSGDVRADDYGRQVAGAVGEWMADEEECGTC